MAAGKIEFLRQLNGSKRKEDQSTLHGEASGQQGGAPVDAVPQAGAGLGKRSRERKPHGSRPDAPARKAREAEALGRGSDRSLARPLKRIKCVGLHSQAQKPAAEALSPDAKIGLTIDALDDVFTRRAIKCLDHLENDQWSPELETAPSVQELPEWSQLPAIGGFLTKRVGPRASQRQATDAEKLDQPRCYARPHWAFVIHLTKAFLYIYIYIRFHAWIL